MNQIKSHIKKDKKYQPRAVLIFSIDNNWLKNIVPLRQHLIKIQRKCKTHDCHRTLRFVRKESIVWYN